MCDEWLKGFRTCVLLILGSQSWRYYWLLKIHWRRIQEGALSVWWSVGITFVFVFVNGWMDGCWKFVYQGKYKDRVCSIWQSRQCLWLVIGNSLKVRESAYVCVCEWVNLCWKFGCQWKFVCQWKCKNHVCSIWQSWRCFWLIIENSLEFVKIRGSCLQCLAVLAMLHWKVQRMEFKLKVYQRCLWSWLSFWLIIDNSLSDIN